MLTPTVRSTPNSQRLAAHAEAIRSLRQKTINNIIEIGNRLLEAKDLAGTGNWLAWLKDEFGWSDQTARNFMNVARQSQNFLNVSLPISSLYQLAKPSTPPAVRNAIVEKAKTGEVRTHRQVVETVRAARPVTQQPRTIARPDVEPDDEFVEAVHAARTVVAKPEPRPAPAMNGMPADFVQAKQAVEIFVSVSVHLFSRERMEALERLEEPALRERVHDELARIIDQAEALQAKLSVH